MPTEDKFPDWFSAYAKPNFEKYLIPLAGQRNLSFLQLGAYTGDASVWMLENVLTHPYTMLLDVDTWEGSDEEEHKKMDFSEVEQIYTSKVKPFKQGLYNSPVACKSRTIDFLLQNRNTLFDFVYVDADHTAASVLLDAELSWPLIKSGGIMAFDDYEWGAHLPRFQSPKLGIDMFLNRHIWEYEVLEHGLQVWIRKL